jgi:hypothetical protein
MVIEPDDGRQPNTFQTACLHEPETPEPLNSQDAWLFDDYDHVVLEARMPVFFFDYRGDDGRLERDEEGIEAWSHRQSRKADRALRKAQLRQPVRTNSDGAESGRVSQPSPYSVFGDREISRSRWGSFWLHDDGTRIWMIGVGERFLPSITRQSSIEEKRPCSIRDGCDGRFVRTLLAR